MSRSSKNICLLTLLTTVSLAHGQQFEDAASTQVGDFDFTPTVNLGFEYDDNVTQNNQESIDSWSFLIAPQFNMFTSFGTGDLAFSYRIENKSYFSSEEDDFTDHFLRADTNIELDARNRVKATLNYEDGHDDRGSNFSIGQGASLAEPDQYRLSSIDLLYSYGAFNADGRIELNLNLLDKNYEINTPVYRARDRKFSTFGGTFFYRVGAATDMTLDLSRTYVDYKFAIDADNTLDSSQDSILIGVEWEATALTSGFAKIGYQTKDFDSPLREDFSGVDWALGVLWEPVEYSSIEISTRADTNETNGEGNFIRAHLHSIEWRHDWLERLRTQLKFSVANNRYEGQLVEGFDIRSDDNHRFRASVYYQFRRWLNFELSYLYDERDSNRESIDFDRNRLMLNALITL